MKYLYRSLCILLLLLPPLLSAQPLPQGGSSQVEAPSRVVVVALRVGRKLSEADQSLLFGHDEGTRIDMIVSCPGRTIVGYDRSHSTVTTFRDDAGTDLVRSDKNEDGSLAGGAWVKWPMVSKDRHEFAFYVEGPDIPAPEAAKIQLKATLSLLFGSALTTKIYPNVLLRDGISLTVGARLLSLREAKNAKKPKTGMDVILSSGEPLDLISNITILGPGGTVLLNAAPADGSTGDSSDGDGNVAYFTTFSLPRKVDRAAVKITYYARVESKPIVIDNETSVGLR